MSRYQPAGGGSEDQKSADQQVGRVLYILSESVEVLSSQVRRWAEEVANIGDACKQDGHPSTRCWKWKAALRHLAL